MKTKNTLPILTLLGLLLAASTASATVTTNTFTTSGSWIAPAGVTAVTVETWGGGGGGGGHNNTSGNGAGGGGGGAYARVNSFAVTPGQSYSYTVGAAGTAGANTGGTGGNGGSSSFNTTTCVAVGGGGGTGNASGAGGAGGAAASSTGDVKWSGGVGVTGTAAGGGGGGSGGTGSAGNTGVTTTGAIAVTGGGPGGNGGNGNNPGVAPASGPGGGGGGADSAGTAELGGAGFAGQVRITYTVPATVTLGALTQTYTGSPLTPTATTVPAGLTIVWTGAPQTAAGTYPVTATINAPPYVGSASGSFQIQQVTPTLSVANPSVTYNGSPQAATVSAGSVAGTVSNVKYNGSAAVPTAVGTYAITADFAPSDSTDYSSLTGASAGNFVINPVSHWSYRKLITIDHTKVSNSDQANFPVLINLASDSDLSARAQTSGNDIYFTASDGTTKLSYEREAYTSGTGALVAWVKIPTLSHTADTMIYMYYGNSLASDQQDTTGAVWDTNYKGVWHLKENPTGTAPQMKDSTAGANNGTIQGTWTSAQQVTGQIDGALNFLTNAPNVNENIQVANAANFNFQYNTPFSIQYWAKPDTTKTYKQCPVSKVLNSGVFPGYEIGHNNRGPGGTNTPGYVRIILVNSATPTTHQIVVNSASASKLNDGSWHYYSYTYSGSGTAAGVAIYEDGVALSLAIGEDSLASNSIQNTTNVNIGSRNQQGLYYAGVLDEVKISGAVRTPDWIMTEYHNQSSPSTFYSIGTQLVLGPVANPDTVTRDPNTSLKVLQSFLMSNDTGTSISFTGVNSPSTQGATVTASGSYVFYVPVNNNNDTFTYTITDTYGATATGTVTVTVNGTVTPGGPSGSISVVGGVANVTMYGIPGVSYDVQRATDLAGPWTTNPGTLSPAPPITQTAADGSVSFTDTWAGPSAFYRLVAH